MKDLWFNLNKIWSSKPKWMRACVWFLFGAVTALALI
jgi:hypothetical protein